jgi:hypothetical protein
VEGSCPLASSGCTPWTDRTDPECTRRGPRARRILASCAFGAARARIGRCQGANRVLSGCAPNVPTLRAGTGPRALRVVPATARGERCPRTRSTGRGCQRSSEHACDPPMEGMRPSPGAARMRAAAVPWGVRRRTQPSLRALGLLSCRVSGPVVACLGSFRAEDGVFPERVLDSDPPDFPAIDAVRPVHAGQVSRFLRSPLHLSHAVRRKRSEGRRWGRPFERPGTT